ncbi:MAG: hypothetical protein J1F33_03080 [Clostridiales bacterium]|nr:hypothetical protein [Clostridiales bacterium]
MVTNHTHNNDELRQLLLDSCGIMAKYSANCRNDFVAHNSSQNSSENTTCCDWYHSVWQYLRILDCVSSPQWHYEFYKNSFENIFNRKSSLKILICGTADYSLLYLIVSILSNKKCNVKIDVVDLCPTPLKICKWFIENYKNLNKNISINTVTSNITMYSSPYKYDIICSDAFLTRFSVQESKSVICKWDDLLDENGRIITTVRLNELDKSDNKRQVIDLSNDINIFCYKVIASYNDLIDEEKKKLNISVEDLRFMAFRYIIRMKSNNLGGKDKIEDLFESNGIIINKEESEIKSVKGEIYKTDYYRIVAQKIGQKTKRGRK